MIFKVSKLVLSLDFRKCSTIAHLLSDQGTHHKLGHINRKTLNLSNMNHGQPLLMIIRRRHSYGLYLLRWLWPLHNVAIAISEFISCICIALCLLCCGLPSVFFFFSFPLPTGCQRPVGLSRGKAKVCCYSGWYYCQSCHQDNLFLIPARLLHNWDTSKHKVQF